MIKEETKRLIKVMQAHLDGKPLEFKLKNDDKWHDEIGGDFEWRFHEFDYRIKEEIRTFEWRGKNIQWLKRMGDNNNFGIKIIYVDKNGVMVVNADRLRFSQNIFDFLEWSKIIENFIWSDDNQTWRKF